MKSEVVLLVEPDGANLNGKMRAFIISSSLSRIIERCHLSDRSEWIRVWICTNDERALTGQRIFREDLPPVPQEEPEKPVYDERVIKGPLPFTATESPLGWEQKKS